MEKKFVLNDLKGFCCLSYFAVASKSVAEKLTVSIIGNREEGDKTYCSVTCKAGDNGVGLYENSLLTLSEPVTVQVADKGR